MKQKTVIIENNSKTSIVLTLNRSKKTIFVDVDESKIETMYEDEIASAIESLKMSFIDDLVTIKEVTENTNVELTVDPSKVNEEDEVETNKPKKIDVEVESE